MTYSLLDQPWVPVNGPEGVINLPVRRVLAEAHNIDQLAALPPTVNVAILRQVLLPIVLGAEGPPTSEQDWGQRFERGHFDNNRIEEYLDRYGHRFDLLHPTEPFAQVAGLVAANGEVKGPGQLLPAQASGNNVPLFSASTDASAVALSLAEAARWLLHAHCFDTAAIKAGAADDLKMKNGKTTGNPVGSVGRFGVVMPTGRTLFDTLMLNLPIRPDGADPTDRPWWRRDPMTSAWASRPATGILDLLTWQSRRIRLVTSVDDVGDVVVTGIVLCAGDRLSEFPEYEPHATWTIDPKPKAGQLPERPRRHQSGRTAWQGLDALLALPAPGSQTAKTRTSELLLQVGDLRDAEVLDDAYPLGVELVGIEYGNQSAVVENLIHDEIPLPVTALRADAEVGPLLERIADEAGQLVNLINSLEGDLRRAEGSELVPWDKGQRASSRLLYRFDQPIRRLLAGMRDRPAPHDDAVGAWHALARALTLQVAEEVFGEAPATSHQGRVDGNERRHNVPIADLRFRAGLRKVLGPTTDPEAIEEANA